PRDRRAGHVRRGGARRHGRGTDPGRPRLAEGPVRHRGRQAAPHPRPRRTEAERLRARRPDRPRPRHGAEEALEGREGGDREAAAGVPRGSEGEGVPMMDDRPRYTISVAAEIVGMHPQTLRIYESKGLVRPGRTPGGTRLYSERDLERLRVIQRLTTELGLNLAGVQRVLALEDEMQKLRARMERLERQMREEIELVHKQYRRDLVLYSQVQA